MRSRWCPGGMRVTMQGLNWVVYEAVCVHIRIPQTGTQQKFWRMEIQDQAFGTGLVPSEAVREDLFRGSFLSLYTLPSA
jgi:hypothetical protein